MSRSRAGLDRREFGKRLAAGLAGAPFIAEVASARESRPPMATDAARTDAEPPPAPRPELPDEAALLLALVRRRYPDPRLDDAALAGIASKIRGHIRNGELLANAGLKNADEPAFVFSAWRAEGA
ncbi:MAG: hypothetical protein WD066_14245 [Planctomycetaceae bacterium]